MLTLRQQREHDYHIARAAEMQALAAEPVTVDILERGRRRPWNAYWSMYDRLFAADLAGKHVLVPGCGFGEDALRLAMLGARVSAFDLSSGSIEIARNRAARFGLTNIEFGVMPAETMRYPDACFDAVLFVDILHHVDIAATIGEVRRVLKPGGLIIGDELYTHSVLQRVRESRIIANVAYPLMTRWIYGAEKPYITQDEHKIDEAEFRIVRDAMRAPSIEYFGLAEGRLFPNRMRWASRVDHWLMRTLRPIADRLGSRVVFSGRIG